MAKLIYDRVYETVEADVDALRSAVCKTPDDHAVFDLVISRGGSFTSREAIETLTNALCTLPGTMPKWPVAEHVLPLFRQRPGAEVLADRIEAYLHTAKPRPFSLREIAVS